MPTMPPPGMPPIDPSSLAGGGMPGGGPGMPPPSPPPPGGPLGAQTSMGLAALDKLQNKQPSGEAHLQQVRKALDLAQQLISAVLPSVAQWEPKVAKDLHVIGRQIADARINLTKEQEPAPPPEGLMGGMMGAMPGSFPPTPGG